MKFPSIGVIVVGMFAIFVLALVAIGPPSERPAPRTVAEHSPPPPPSSVSAGGFTLVSSSIDMPIDDQQYPDGLNADIINANCTSCHSASMAMTQPALAPDQWKGIVTKMRDVYKAPVSEKDMTAIVSYLSAMPSQQSAAPVKAILPKQALDSSGATG